MSFFGNRSHDYLGVANLRRRNGNLVLKNHLRLSDGTLVSLDELRKDKAFRAMERSEQRKLERAAKDGATLSETESNAIVNPESGKVTDDFAKQDQTAATTEKLDRALESQGMKAQAEAFNKAEQERFDNLVNPPAPAPDPVQARQGRADGSAGVDEPYMTRGEMEKRSQEDSDLLVSLIEPYYPTAAAAAGN